MAPITTTGFTYFPLGEVRLVLLAATEVEKFTGTPFSNARPGALFSLNVEKSQEIEAILTRVAGAGGRVIKPAVESAWGRYALFADPENNLWELAWRPE